MAPKRKPTTKPPPMIAAIAAANNAKKSAQSATSKSGSSSSTSTSKSTNSNASSSTTHGGLKRPNSLPSKEAGLFKQSLKMYEMKQYKKGLKTIEQVLKKVPNHGESLSMRGLFMFQLDNKEEGYKQIEKGIEIDPDSSIVWHVYGLAYRGDKNYAEAVKCYNKALVIDPHNAQILRDLATLQIHVRDYTGCIATREKLARYYRGPNQRPQLIGLAIAHHMLGQHSEAIALLDLYADTFKPHPPPRDWDFSEMLLFRNQLLYELGDLDTALSHLDVIEPLVCDVRSVKESRAQFLLHLGRSEQAMQAYTTLIKRNPDCKAFIDGFISASGEKPVDVLEGLVDDYPRSNLIQVMFLVAAKADSDLFASRLRSYLSKNLVQGVPSLFANLRQLYDDKDKPRIIATIMHDLMDNPSDGLTTSHEGKMWGEYFLAQHYDRLAHYTKAMDHVKRAIAEQPPCGTDSGHEDESSSLVVSNTVPELLLLQARIYKHTGHLDTARQFANSAREADLHDRSVNTKCVKYMLRANDLTGAEEVVVKFARPDLTEPLLDLVDMQCQWFAYEAGQTYVRMGRYGPAIKRFMQIVDHFKQFEDDQFDFHVYCLRRMTLRSYVDTLKWETRCRNHPYFIRAAAAAIQQYLHLHHMLGTSKLQDHIDEAADAVKVAKKAIAKKKKDLASGKESDKDGTVILPDADPLGHSYLTETDPLSAAHTLVKMLEQAAGKQLCTHLAAFDVAFLQERWVVAMRAIQKMVSLAPMHPEVHIRSISLAYRVAQSDVDTAVRGLVVKGLNDLFSTEKNETEVPSVIDVVALNETYLSTAIAEGILLPLATSATAGGWIVLGELGKARTVITNFLKQSPREAWHGTTLKIAQKSWSLVRESVFTDQTALELSMSLESSAREWFAIE